jgi:hypothetical protein
MLGEPREPEPAFLARIERVQSWTRQRFKLPADAAVLVSEMACTLAGCQPLETVVAFWTEDDQRHQFKLYKPMKDVRYDDIGWLMGGAASHDGAGWDCC